MSFLAILALGVVTWVCYLIGQGTNSTAAAAAGGFFIGIIVLYFCPAIVASMRSHRSRSAIIVLNVLLGWTLLGWAGALVWAYTGGGESEVKTANLAAEEEAGKVVEAQPEPEAPALKKCPYCAEEIKAEAIRCKHCQADLTAESAWNAAV